MWTVQIKFNGEWVDLGERFLSRGDAEWIIGKWKQEMNCTGDSLFRAVLAPEVIAEESGR